MRLMDQVSQTREPILVLDNNSDQVARLPGAALLANTVAACPLRYVLNDAVVETCTRLGFGDDTLLASAIDLLRCPAPSLWIEFKGIARNAAYVRAACLSALSDPISDQRLGLLVQSDASGRRGTLHSCWESSAGKSPEVAPFVAEFDFDNTYFSERLSENAGGENAGSCQPAAYVQVCIDDLPALEPLFRHVRFRIQPEWQAYYRRRCADQATYERAVHAAVTPLAEDIPFFAAFALLLMAHNATRPTQVEFSRLNRTRAKRGKAPLLDHTELTLELGREADGWTTRQDDDRTPSRWHFVRDHLVRRDSTVYWRSAHMRGRPDLGAVSNRTVSVRFAAE